MHCRHGEASPAGGRRTDRPTRALAILVSCCFANFCRGLQKGHAPPHSFLFTFSSNGGTTATKSHTMAQNLIRRRHVADEHDDPAPQYSGGGNIELSSAANENNVGAPDERIDASSNIDNNVSNISNTSNQSSNPLSTDEEEQELIVRIPINDPSNSDAPFVHHLPSTWEPTEQSTALRRDVIRREVLRIQRANFVHFVVLCLVPTTLLLIVVAAIISEDGECSGDELTICEREPRSFVNAFTSRCICDAVKMLAEDVEGVGGDGNDDGV